MQHPAIRFVFKWFRCTILSREVALSTDPFVYVLIQAETEAKIRKTLASFSRAKRKHLKWQDRTALKSKFWKMADAAQVIKTNECITNSRLEKSKRQKACFRQFSIMQRAISVKSIVSQLLTHTVWINTSGQNSCKTFASGAQNINKTHTHERRNLHNSSCSFWRLLCPS